MMFIRHESGIWESFSNWHGNFRKKKPEYAGKPFLQITRPHWENFGYIHAPKDAEKGEWGKRAMLLDSQFIDWLEANKRGHEFMIRKCDEAIAQIRKRQFDKMNKI